METVLLIDGKNTAYRALFAARGNREFRHQYHPFAVWLKFTHVWLARFKPTAVHVFWDCHKNDIWRRKILSEYKEHRVGMPHYADDIQEDLRSMLDAAAAILPYLGVRQYYRDHQECDDLIYSACRVLTPPKTDTRKVVVVSSDSDFLQLPWAMPHVALYLPKDRKLADRPDCDPAVQKALSGDKSDNVDGFRGIGPVKARRLASDKKQLVEFLGDSRSKKFKRNLALIDLSMNPANLSNQLYIIMVMSQDVKFDKAAINRLSIEHKVKGLMAEYPKFAQSFKHLQ